MINDLRGFLNLLEEKKDLVHISRPTSPRFEIAAGDSQDLGYRGAGPILRQRHRSFHAGSGRALRGAPARDLGPGNDAGKHSPENHGRTEKPYPAAHGQRWPLQRGDIDGRRCRFRPVCRSALITPRTPVRLLPSASVSSVIPEYGSNVSISRMQIYDGKTMGCRSVPPQHLGVYFRDMESKGKPVEVAFTIGNDPYVALCSQVSGSIFLDELADGRRLDGTTGRRGEVRNHRCQRACHQRDRHRRRIAARESPHRRTLRRVPRLLPGGHTAAGV